MAFDQFKTSHIVKAMRFFLIQHAFLLFAFFVSCKLQGQESKEPEKTVELAGYYKMAMVYLNGDGVDQNYPLAFKWFEKAAKLGHAESQFNLGWMYSSGAGGIKDLALAAKCYSQAADQGLTVAQFNLGRAYHNGEGISQDFEKAVHWYSIAANKGHAMAQNNST